MNFELTLDTEHLFSAFNGTKVPATVTLAGHRVWSADVWWQPENPEGSESDAWLWFTDRLRDLIADGLTEEYDD